MKEGDPQKTVVFEYAETDKKTGVRTIEIEVVDLETLKTIRKDGPMKLEEYQNGHSQNQNVDQTPTE